MCSTPFTERHHIGLIGAGIDGSLSPELHETEATRLGVPYRYSLLDLETEGMPARDAGVLLCRAVASGYTGLNITHPCKQIVLAEVDELSADARALGAVNTVVIRGDRLVGHNTDHSGFLTGLRHGLPQARLDRATVVGAGGAGSATAYALLSAGASALDIADINPDTAHELCCRLAPEFPTAALNAMAVSDIPGHMQQVDGIVNASPIGMEGHPGIPFDPSGLRARHWVVDVVYRPMETDLLRTARATGCAVLDGGAMLVAQAAETFELFTGIIPDVAIMRRHLQHLMSQTGKCPMAT